jgi:FSR family fosmidomycin resistance protein-like MFS transporter
VIDQAHWTRFGPRSTLPIAHSEQRHLLAAPLVLGLAHGVLDGSAGFLLGRLPGTMAIGDVALLVLLYNVLAFASQPIAGLLVDRRPGPRTWLLGTCGLMAVALAAPGPIVLAVILAGLASAVFHVAGGTVALAATPGRAAGPGLFTAPGVVGLVIGGGLALAGFDQIWPFLLTMALLAIVIARLPLERAPDSGAEAVSTLEGHDVVMIALISAVALRSAAWSAWDLALHGQITLLLAAGLAAGIGKLAGGFAADRVGWRRWAVGALLVSTALLAAGPMNPWTFLPGIALLQSATPVALAAAGQLMPRRPATASGLILGLAVAAGGVLARLGLGPHGALAATVTAAMLLAWSLGALGPPAPALRGRRWQRLASLR